MRTILLLIAVSLCGCASPKTSLFIPNFQQVDSGIYRGGQPSKEGWDYLKSIGVTNVVKLNKDSEGSDSYADSLRMNVHRFPISLIQQTIGEPSSNQLWAAVQAIRPGTFVHCEHGWDRTSLVVAMYRVKVDGWTKKDAESEMMHLGFHPKLRGLYWAWQDYVP